MNISPIILNLLLLVSCSSTKLVSTWKNPEIGVFKTYKVLVVGMAQDETVRRLFESRLMQRLKEQGIEAMRSTALFEVAFRTSQRSEEDLNKVEQELLYKGFDAIILTKITGIENKKTLRENMNKIDALFSRFSSDYLEHQNLYYSPEPFKSYTIYHAETSLYCICVDKERELIWKGNVDITQPKDKDTAIAAYIKLMTDAMKEEEVIF